MNIVNYFKFQRLNRYDNEHFLQTKKYELTHKKNPTQNEMGRKHEILQKKIYFMLLYKSKQNKLITRR